MGIDRWLGLAAVWRPGQRICVISAGTALTLDFVEPAGEHLGGFIAPGIDLGRQALGDYTAQCARTQSACLMHRWGRAKTPKPVSSMRFV